MLRDTQSDIAKAGILAPSADNDHVFRLEFMDAGIRLWPTTAFAASTEPLRRVLGLIALGAVVENMRLRAGELLHETWAARLDTLGRDVSVGLSAGVRRGLAVGVTPEGALIVRWPEGREEPVWAGDVTAVR